MRPVKLALTGTIGVGKSRALALFNRLGAHVLDCDDIVHALLKGADKTITAKIIKTFGARVARGGGVDRKTLGKQVFNDPTARRKLERILHPVVIATLLRKARAARGQVFVAEVPLLFETGLQNILTPRLQSTRQ